MAEVTLSVKRRAKALNRFRHYFTGIVDDIMAGSFVIRQSKTILARYCEAGRAKYHFVIAVWRAKEAESRRNDQRPRLRVGSVGSLNLYRGVPRGDAQGLFEETWSVNGQGQKDVAMIRGMGKMGV